MTLVYLILAWLFGIMLAHLLWSAQVVGCAAPGWPLGVVAASALGVALLNWSDRRRRLIAALALAAALGAWRYHIQPVQLCPHPGDLAPLHADAPVPAVVEGVVVDYPEQGDRETVYRLRADSAIFNGVQQPVQGDIRVSASLYPSYRYGDRLRASGKLRNAYTFADFDYRAYLARQGIYSTMSNVEITYIGGGEGRPLLAALYDFKARASQTLDRLLPEPYAALANGMLLGIESGIPAELDEAFRAAGATHVIVISGSNVALLAGVLLALIGRLVGRTRAVLPVVVSIALYVLLVGAEPSALRAGLMGILVVVAIGLGRRSTAWISLAFSALLMTAINPLALWSVSFEISFAAMFGLVAFFKPISEGIDRLLARVFPGRGVPASLSAFGAGAAATLAAQALVLPVLLFHFGSFSLVSPLVNALILPAQPPILAGGMAALIAGMAWEPLGRVLSVIPWLFLRYTTGVVQVAAQASHATFSAGEWGRTAALIYTATLAGGWSLVQLTRSGRIALPGRRTLVLAAAFALPVWLGAAVTPALPDSWLHVAFVPRSGGEAVQITTPEGRRIWLGEGAPNGAPNPGLAVRLAQMGAEEVDTEDLASGTVVRIGEGVTLEKLGAGKNGAVVLRYGEFSALLPPAPDAATQAALVAEGQIRDITALKLPPDKAGASLSPGFLQAAAPQLILWPEETGDPDGAAPDLPAQQIARPPVGSTVELITDGRSFRVQVWSNGAAAGP